MTFFSIRDIVVLQCCVSFCYTAKWISHTYTSMCVHTCSVAQSWPTLCNPMDCSPPGSSVHRFSRQEYWSGLPFPSPGDLPDPGIKPISSASPALQVDSLLLSHWRSPCVCGAGPNYSYAERKLTLACISMQILIAPMYTLMIQPFTQL